MGDNLERKHLCQCSTNFAFCTLGHHLVTKSALQSIKPLQLQKWEIIIIISYWQFLERKSRFFPVLTSASIGQVTGIVSQISVWNKNSVSLPEQVEILFLVGDFGGLQKKNCCPVVILTI